MSQPNMHEYYLVYPSESGNNAGKKVPLSKHNIARDYGGKSYSQNHLYLHKFESLPVF